MGLKALNFHLGFYIRISLDSKFLLVVGRVSRYPKDLDSEIPVPSLYAV